MQLLGIYSYFCDMQCFLTVDFYRKNKKKHKPPNLGGAFEVLLLAGSFSSESFPFADSSVLGPSPSTPNFGNSLWNRFDDDGWVAP